METMDEKELDRAFAEEFEKLDAVRKRSMVCLLEFGVKCQRIGYDLTAQDLEQFRDVVTNGTPEDVRTACDKFLDNLAL